MDDIFGEHFQNEIVVRSTFAHADAGRFGSVHQAILFYTKTEIHKHHPIYVPYENDYVEKYYVYAAKGKHTACVKVIDTFGCDTSITVEVDV